MRALKFTLLNLTSAFAWAGSIMLFVKAGATTLSAIGLNAWWGPLIPAAVVVLFFRWLAHSPK
jgi:membrane protein DedA with SNARE-associated domain